MLENNFAGSGILSRFIIKRDKIRQLIWILGLTAFFICFVPVFKDMFQSGGAAERAVSVEMMKNPAMIAIVGPVYGAANYTTGAMYANFMLVFSAMLAGVMSIGLVTRHTRHDEELGRLEVIRSLPVGRLSNLTSTISVMVLSNVILSVLTGVGMYLLREDGMTANGCFLFGAGCGIVGIFFGVSTAIFCQITANNRTATSLSYMWLMVLYLIRAAGDIKDNDAFANISPLGMVLRTKTFVKNQWWPIFAILGISIVLLIAAFILASRRDLTRGLLPEKPGRRHGSVLMSSSYGLALRLLRTTAIIWAVTVFILAGMYGSVFGDLDSFIGNNEMLSAIFTANSHFSVAEQFMSFLMVIMALITSIPVLSSIGKIAAEEKRGHAEHVLGKAVSRSSQMTAYLVPALVLSVVLQVLAALGFWVVGSTVLDTIPSLKVFMISALSYLPAIWVLAGVALVLTAFLPGKMYLSYAYLAYAFFAVYLGTVAKLPEWLKKLSPFGYIAQYPTEKLKAAPLIIMTGIAIVLGIIGYLGYRNRDVKNPS